MAFKAKTLNRTLMFSFFIGLFLGIFEIQIYRETIISWLIPFSICLTSGTILTFITSKYWERYCFISNFYLQLLCSIISFGSPLTCTFMAINYFANQENTKIQTFKILSKSSMSGPKNHLSQRSPLVYIKYQGHNKELVFGYNNTYEVENADSVVLETYSGNLGFDVIKGWALKPKSEK